MLTPSPPEPVAARPGSPFDLHDEHAYRGWRDARLAAYPRSVSDVLVEIEDLARPTPAERVRILDLCRRANMAVYRCAAMRDNPDATRPALGALIASFGMNDVETHRSAEADGIVALEVVAGGGRRGFIPYTTLPIGWHTDGYYAYEGPQRMVRSMVLHCVRNAAAGGENRLLDHQIAYIRLRDRDPAFIEALMRPDAMTIPAHREEDGRLRPDNAGPVFIVDPRTGALAMRYTERKRNIAWKQDAATLAAVAALEEILATDPLVLRMRLEPGMGIICNNVLHDRGRFEDRDGPGAGRLLYRIRCYDRVGEGRMDADGQS